MARNFFILITSDVTTIRNKRLSSFQIASERLKKSKWTIFSGTKYKEQIKSGDLCVFYLAGQMKLSQHFIAMAMVGEIKKWEHGMKSIDSKDWLLEEPTMFLTLIKTTFFVRPISVRPLLKEFTFLPKNRKKWGVCFMGGVRRLDEINAQIIINELDSKTKNLLSLN